MEFSKKVLSGVLTAGMVGTMMCSTAFAASSELVDGDYTGTIHFLNANGNGSNSMCDPIFVHQADVSIEGDNAEVSFYVAFPIPSFSDQGVDGTIKDVKVTFNDTTYEGVSDITSKPVKSFDTASPIFGINADDELPTQVITVELPKAALDTAETGELSVSAYVNVFMNTTQNFFMKLTDLQAAGGDEPAVEEKSMEITANVAEPAPSEPEYTVTVPASVAMGALSTEKDSTAAYEVKVTAENLNGGSVTVSAPETGSLTNDSKGTLAFANDFAERTVSEDTEGMTLKGNITIKAADVADAAAGNYTGTTTFSFSYAEAN